MWDKVKSGTAVVIITVLIWFTADQQVSEEGTFDVPVRLVSAAANRHVSFAAAPFQVTFKVTVIGRRRHLKEFGEIIASKNVFDAVVDESKETSTEPQAMSGKEILGFVREVNAASVRIRSVEPPAVNVRIDEYETIPNVRVTCNFGELKVSAEPVPPKLTVRLPRFAAQRLRADPVATAEAEPRILAARKPDGSFTVKVPVAFEALKDFDPDMRVEILPTPEVQISGQIEAQTVTRRKGPVQITWSVPQQVQEEFKIVVDPASSLRVDVDISGPKEFIDQLDPREIRAFVDVMAADAETPRTSIRRAVQFVLPPGFALATTASRYEVTFHLEPKANSGSP